MNVERKSYNSFFLPADRPPEDVLRLRPVAKLYNDAKPLILCVDPDNADTEPTAEEARQFHAIGLHMQEQIGQGRVGTISTVWTRDDETKTEFIVPPIAVARKTAAKGWLVGVFDTPTATSREYMVLNYVVPRNPQAEHPTVPAVATTITNALEMDEISPSVDQIGFDTKLPPFPCERVRCETFIAAAKAELPATLKMTGEA